MKFKAFFIIFEVLSLKQIATFFWEGDSPTLSRILESIKSIDICIDIAWCK